MDALPDELPEEGAEAFTGLVCPECSGNLVVQRSARFVTFQCRVGHVYSVQELVTAKESTLETRMWSSVFAFEELEALLIGLGAHGLTDQLGTAACRERAAVARGQAQRLRAIIQDDRPLMPRADGGREAPRVS